MEANPLPFRASRLQSQRRFTDEHLFRHYLISSSREEEVFSPFPAFLDRQIFEAMTESAVVLDRLIRRLTAEICRGGFNLEMDDFPFREEILRLPLPLQDFFWTRYDAFCQADGSIFFTEFNYDKPCAEREIVISESLNPPGFKGPGFARNFRNAFASQVESAGFSLSPSLSTALLVDPCHYEEAHLAHLFIDLLGISNCIIAGAKNITVRKGRAYAFDKEIQVIMRQYPTEFLYEIEQFGELLELISRGSVLMLNDPRAIVGQAKSIFALLGSLAREKSPFITEKERAVIEATIPRTRLYCDELIDEIVAERENLVIKSVFGRYSEEVYIGIMNSPHEWLDTIDYVKNSPKKHIVQQFRLIKTEIATRYCQGNYIDIEAFANYGIFLQNGAYGGICARWTEDYLTGDDIVWFTPLGIRQKSFSIVTPAIEDRAALWEKLNDRISFSGGCSGGYTGDMEYFTLQYLALDRELHGTLVTASEKLCPLFARATGIVKRMPHLFLPLLGIDRSLQSLITEERTDELSFLGRMDWAVDNEGNIKLMEFNSETPGGLIESLVMLPMIAEELSLTEENPNRHMGEKIVSQFRRIAGQLSKTAPLETIGLVSSAYYEDWHNTEVLYNHLKPLPYRFVLGEVSGLEAHGDHLRLFGSKLDALYRYYPLDWFAGNDCHEIIKAMSRGTPCINPPSTLISQSKAFFALLWELSRQGILEEEEIDLIKKYIPCTELEADTLHSLRFCMKPYFGREGQGVKISTPMLGAGEEQNLIYQEMIDIQPVHIERHSTYYSQQSPLTPVIGIYVTGSEYAGTFVRAGGLITDRQAHFIPTFLE